MRETEVNGNVVINECLKMAKVVGISTLLVGVMMGCATGPDRDSRSIKNEGEWQSSLKQAKSLGYAWEKEFGYAQGVRAKDTIYVAGQFSLDRDGKIMGKADMETQLRQAYANVTKVLRQYNATMQNVVDEVIFVTNMEAALTVMPLIRKEVFGQELQVTSTLVQVSRLPFPDALVEIKVTAELQFLPRLRGGGSEDKQPNRKGGGRRGGGQKGGGRFPGF
ncbi:MAG: hypothetical protein NPIRA02_41920 [Nitrospirales bacterium]|nr:MAG: hypothetical protein NPIRA02_41920 [Nitrospirales bacterium]